MLYAYVYVIRHQSFHVVFYMTGMVYHVCRHLCLAMEDTAAVCCNDTCLLLCQYDRYLCGKRIHPAGPKRVFSIQLFCLHWYHMHCILAPEIVLSLRFNSQLVETI